MNYKAKNYSYNKLSQRVFLSEGLFDKKMNDQKVDENEQWLNTDEAATYLRVSPNALRILVHRAKVKSFKFGSRLRFKLSDLISVLQPKEY
jgi:excisionase family DNA binding protein